jgi:hypothetical protein
MKKYQATDAKTKLIHVLELPGEHFKAVTKIL